jgi:hypothetical protein
LWGEEAQLNERIEWIRREDSRKLGNMDLGPIQIVKINFIFGKSSQLEFSWK